MLVRLYIQNYAIIEEIELNFHPEFNVITGETGTGKSILLGALGLILGNRFDNSVLFDKSRKCIIEGTFFLENNNSFFVSHDLDFEKETIVRREISPSGKSRAFINDTPVTLDVLKEFAETQIDIHTQHQTLQINSTDFRLLVLDTVAANQKVKKEYQDLYFSLKSKKKELEYLSDIENKAKNEHDYFLFQLNEIQTLNINPDKDILLQEEFNILNNADKIRNNIENCLQIIENQDTGLLFYVNEIRKNLSEISSFNNKIEELKSRFDSMYFELKDLLSELLNFFHQAESDPEHLERVTQRLDTINSLLSKYRLTSIDQLLEYEKNLQEKINNYESLSEKISVLSKEIEVIEGEMKNKAEELSRSRKKVIPDVEKKLIELLTYVGMKKAKTEIVLSPKPEENYNETGKDNVEILFSSNPGIPLQSLSKSASGGELSRIMLCIKTILAGSSLLSTLIFDEIDQGVSGETAFQVARLISQIARKHQVICITHLPQIAASGQQHFLVLKKHDEKSTLTTVKSLNEKEREIEIAKMIAGDPPSEIAIKNARMLLNKK